MKIDCELVMNGLGLRGRKGEESDKVDGNPALVEETARPSTEFHLL